MSGGAWEQTLKMKWKFDKSESQMMDTVHDTRHSIYAAVVPISLSFEMCCSIFCLTVVTIITSDGFTELWVIASLRHIVCVLFNLCVHFQKYIAEPNILNKYHETTEDICFSDMLHSPHRHVSNSI